VNVNGCIAVVTGGARGIGAGICRALHEEGTKVVVVDLDAQDSAKFAARIDGQSFAADVGSEAELTSLINEVEESIGPIDIFVSNAGVGFGDGPTGAADRTGGIHPAPDRWATSWNVNVMAHVVAARVLVPRMIKRGSGYFVNVASAAGLLSQIGDAAYATTKHAAVAFAESLRITHGEQGIGVSVLCPQAVATRMIGFDEESRELNILDVGGAEIDGILSTEEVATHVIEAIRDERFMILPHPQVKTYFQRKAEDHDRWIEGMQRFRQVLKNRLDAGKT
jgi:NAD(P)-dependent dehydrogenase (short-subunit alcohol dehydrogenase family)